MWFLARLEPRVCRDSQRLFRRDRPVVPFAAEFSRGVQEAVDTDVLAVLIIECRSGLLVVCERCKYSRARYVSETRLSCCVFATQGR